MRTAIMDERRVELAFENKRWLDLIPRSLLQRRHLQRISNIIKTVVSPL